MHEVYDPFSPVQGQQRLRAAGDPLLPLPIPSDLHQELTIASRQGILRRFASSHRRLLFSESRTICSCSSKSNLLNYLGYSPLSLPVPTYSTLSRRGARSEIELSRLPSSGPVHLVLDASGVKGSGEGEWKVRQHGWRTRRTWRKLPLGGDEATGEIVAAVASEAGITDDDVVPDLVEQVDRPIQQVSADGA